MEKAFFYNYECGVVFRCMFAGIDNNGHAQWVIITPGEQSRTLMDYSIEEDFEGEKYVLLCMEGEKAQPVEVARMLGKLLNCPLDYVGKDLSNAAWDLRSKGVQWEHTPLVLEVKVFEDVEGSLGFLVKETSHESHYLANVRGFASIEELFDWVNTYFYTLSFVADIPIMSKTLTIKDNLKKQMSKSLLSQFDHIMEDRS